MGVGLWGSDCGGRTVGVELGVERDRTRAFHVQKRIKHFSFKNYTKILLNLVNFSLPLQSSWGDVNIKMAFSTKRKKIYLKIRANQANFVPSPHPPHRSLPTPPF